MATSTVVIIGAGVIGLSAAYHLATRRLGRVIVLEKDAIGAGSSSRAAGITTRLLWTETGIRARGIGIDWFGRLSDELKAYGYTYHNEHGCLNLFTRESWLQRAALLPMYDRLGAKYEALTAGQIHRRWPALNPPDDLIGLHDPTGGYSEPAEYLGALTRTLQDLGVEILRGQTARQLVVAHGRVAGVVTSTARFGADAVISGIHSWGEVVWKRWGLLLPMKSFVHQRYLSTPMSRPLVAPAVNADPYGGYLRPAGGNRLLLGIETPDRMQFNVERVEFNMNELTASPGLPHEGIGRFAGLVPAVTRVRWEDQRVGLIAFSSDGEPILGPVKQIPGLFVAGAFHSGGFSYNTFAGLCLAEMVAGEVLSVDVAAFSPDRFTRESTEAYLAEQVPQSRAVRRRH